jgi:hypothetical protein
MVLAATGNSSGYMGFSVNNSERMRIEANGSVGITGNVSVASGTTNTSITVTSAGGGAQVTMSSFGGTLGILGSTNNIPVDLMTNGVSRMRIDTSGRITTPFQPAFTAYGGSVVSVSISNYVLALTATMTNRGSHYNTSNFRFTAPVAGTYLFAHRITFASTGTGVVVYLAVNGGPAGGSSSITEVFGYNVTNMGTTYHTTSASISVVTLNVNDFVDLRTVIYNASPQSLDLSRCSLTGYLLG